MAQKYVAYVGSYTYYGSSKGISIMDVDVEKGIFTKRKEVSVNNCSYLVASRDNKYLYSVVDEGVAAFKILPNGDLERYAYLLLNRRQSRKVSDHGRLSRWQDDSPSFK